MPEVKKDTPPENPEGTVRKGPSPAPNCFTLAHVSDLHLTTLNNTTVCQLLNKRMLGYLSWWRKRRFVHRFEIVEALLEDLKTIQPDHIAVTGDLTHLGLPDEFAEAGLWLAQLGPPDQVTVIPGNHEAYVGQKWSDLLQEWAAYLKSDDDQASRGDNGFFPSLRINGPVALIGLCSARPSLPFLAIGSLDQGQLDKLAKLLQTTGDAGLLRVVLVHHQPIPGMIKWRKRLVDSEAFIDVLTRHGAELVLHGHTHASSFSRIPTPTGEIPVIGVPSGSELNPAKDHCAGYNIYQIGNNGMLTMSVRRYSEAMGRFTEERDVSIEIPYIKKHERRE